MKTLEVRWFFRGGLPAEVEDWYLSAVGEAQSQPARIDAYLPLPDDDTLGVKLREGGLEVKRRVKDHGLVQFSPEVVGKLEHWQKWQFAAEKRFSDSPHDWIEVWKQRWLRVCDCDADAVRVIEPGEVFPSQGCSWELTQVRVGNARWWSMGFEAFGADEGLDRLLTLTAQGLLSTAAPIKFMAEHSKSYPAWLSNFIENTEK